MGLQIGIQAQQMLLIVPYGIETEIKKYEKSKKWLLIVPYGIETL